MQGDLGGDDLSLWLQQTGGNIDLADRAGLTLLMWAAGYGQVPTAELLVGRGAGVDLVGREQETALHLAARSELSIFT